MGSKSLRTPVITREMEPGFHSGVLGAPRGAYFIPWIIIRRMIFDGLGAQHTPT